MITPNIYKELFDNAEVNAFVSNRIYNFGDAGNSEDIQKPYIVYQYISGVPENYLDKQAEVFTYTIQFDVYSSSSREAEQIASKVLDVLEKKCYINNVRGGSVDFETRDNVFSFDVDWIHHR